jgi:hypothetical protein
MSSWAIAHADRPLAMGFTTFTLGLNGPARGIDAGAAWLTLRDARNA